MDQVINAEDLLNAYGPYNNDTISYGPMSENRYELIDIIYSQVNQGSILNIIEDVRIKILIDELIMRPLEYPMEFFNYILEKEYVRKEDPNFQNKMLKLLCNKYYCSRQENNVENCDFFEYSLNHYLLSETIRMHNVVHETNSTTLFHKLLFPDYYLGDEYMDRMFTLFDNAGFDYNVEGCVSLMGISFMQNLPYVMRKLYERGVSVQTEIIGKKIAKTIRSDMCYIKRATEQSHQYLTSNHIQTVEFWNAVHQKIYDNVEHILFFADLQKCDEEVEEKLLLIMNEIDPHFDEYTSIDEYISVYSKYSREFSFPTSAKIRLYSSSFQCLKDLGYNMHTLIEADDVYSMNVLMPMTALDMYLRGSKYIELLHRDLHDMFVEILTPE